MSKDCKNRYYIFMKEGLQILMLGASGLQIRKSSKEIINPPASAQIQHTPPSPRGKLAGNSVNESCSNKIIRSSLV